MAVLIEEHSVEAGLALADLALKVADDVPLERVSDRALKQLAGLRGHGAQFWPDDFGTGHAELP